jgi:hypothetical protein
MHQKGWSSSLGLTAFLRAELKELKEEPTTHEDQAMDEEHYGYQGIGHNGQIVP